MEGRRFRLDGPIVAAAVGAVCLAYWKSLSFDLFEDDYFLLRPWSPTHMLAAFSGPWLEADRPDYFRPLAIIFYKALFFVFGLNTAALHVLPLVLMSAVSSLVGMFVRRELASVPLGMAAAVLYAWHPGTATAIGPWIVNQYQGIVSLCVMVAFVWWWRCRDQDWRHWVPLCIPMLVAALTKETGLLIPLMIVAAHGARAWWGGTVKPLGWRLAAAGVAMFVALNVWRIAALGSLGESVSAPTWRTVSRFLRPLLVLFVEPSRVPVPQVTPVFVVVSVLLLMAAVWAVLFRRSTPAAGVAIVGAAILLCASVPTSVVYSHERLAPHGVGVVLILTAGAAALAGVLRGRAQVALVVVGTVALASGAVLTGTVLDQFRVCRSKVLNDPEHLYLEPRMPPPEMVDWMQALPRPCRSRDVPPLYQTASTLTWGVVDLRVGPDARVHRWLGDRIVALLTPHAERARIAVRHLGASVASPVRLRVVAAGDTSHITLTSGAWHVADVPLPTQFWLWTRRMHRLEIHADAGRGSAIEMQPLGAITPPAGHPAAEPTGLVAPAPALPTPQRR